MSESRVDSCQWPTSGIGVALRRSDDWPFSTGPQAIGLISGFYTQVEVVPASLARELEAELRVATDETQTEAKPESLEEESPAAVPVDGEARIPDPGLTREEATSIGPGFGPITEATPCACGAIQPCHYCPVNASARAKLRASLAAADKGENDG